MNIPGLKQERMKYRMGLVLAGLLMLFSILQGIIFWQNDSWGLAIIFLALTALVGKEFLRYHVGLNTVNLVLDHRDSTTEGRRDMTQIVVNDKKVGKNNV